MPVEVEVLAAEDELLSLVLSGVRESLGNWPLVLSFSEVMTTDG